MDLVAVWEIIDLYYIVTAWWRTVMVPLTNLPILYFICVWCVGSFKCDFLDQPPLTECWHLQKMMCAPRRVWKCEAVWLVKNKSPSLIKVIRQLGASTIVLYNALLTCPLLRLNQRSPSTDVMCYKCYNSIWVSHMATVVEMEHLSVNCRPPFITCNVVFFYLFNFFWESSWVN